MSIAWESRVTQMTVAPNDDPVFSEMATQVSIADESAGEFVEVSQESRSGYGKIAIDPEEWPLLRRAIDQMIEACRGEP